MSLVEKMKKLFLEEEEDEIKTDEVKKEVTQVEIKAPVKEVVRQDIELPKPTLKEEYYEVPVKAEPKEEVKAPIFFDDNYFKELEKPKVEVKSTYKKELTQFKESKKFTPTPIISPVYGVLNKNYNKEDIVDRNDVASTINIKSGVTIDDVRKKAYGTLEDELESSLFETPKKTALKDEFFEELIDIDFDTKEVNGSELLNLIDTMYEEGEI